MKQKSDTEVPPMPIMDKIGKTVKNKKKRNSDTCTDIDDLPEDLANMLLDDSVF